MRNVVIAIAALLAVSAAAGYAQSRKMAAVMIQDHLLSADKPQETAKTLDPRQFARAPYIANTYKAAREIPGVLDKMFCYCYCEINPKFKHKSLLSCYTDEHASLCGICMRQALDAYAMTKNGKSPEHIAGHFKEKYLNK